MDSYHTALSDLAPCGIQKAGGDYRSVLGMGVLSSCLLQGNHPGAAFFSQLSGILVRLLGKRTNPSLILAGSFLVFILLGTGLLMLPRATYHGISFMDALFTATSATCVTGLVTVDVPSTFTLEGQILIILLIQIGGLGVMTLTSFFAMFFMGNTSLYNQLMVGDMISSNSLNSLLSTLLYILGFTLAIEGVGMVVIWLSVHGTLGMTLQEELFFSAFHSVSAFCNAGFPLCPEGWGIRPSCRDIICFT